MLLTRKTAILEKLATERVGGYKSGLSHDQIKERISKIKATKGGRNREAMTGKLYSDVFGSDYKTLLKKDKRFKHATRPTGTAVGRSMAHSLWAGPFGGLVGPAGTRKKQIKALEKAMKNKAMS
tara:strand:- start:101 stop:472 length:372 start_codon:yes stop_codon:yes gene_type:complete